MMQVQNAKEFRTINLKLKKQIQEKKQLMFIDIAMIVLIFFNFVLASSRQIHN